MTDAGRTLAERGRKLIAEEHRLREELGEDASALSGHIRIGVTMELAQTIYVPVLAAFARDNPGISLEVISIEGQPNLSEGIDVAIVVAHQILLRDSSQAVRRIGSISRMLFASKAYLKERGDLREPADLKRHSCLRLSRGMHQREWELRRGKETRKIYVDGQVSATSVGLLAQFAREHYGIVILTAFLASHPMFGAGLTNVLPGWEAVPAHIFALTAGQTMPAKIAELINALKIGVRRRLSQLESRR